MLGELHLHLICHGTLCCRSCVLHLTLTCTQATSRCKIESGCHQWSVSHHSLRWICSIGKNTAVSKHGTRAVDLWLNLDCEGLERAFDWYPQQSFWRRHFDFLLERICTWTTNPLSSINTGPPVQRQLVCLGSNANSLEMLAVWTQLSKPATYWILRSMLSQEESGCLLAHPSFIS